MPIAPDTKNWTWVLEHPCPECGFDPARVAGKDVPALVRANASAWPAVLERSEVRVRPDDSTWSPLEYAAHVRDVFRLFDVRLRLMLEQDDPLYPDWDQDAAAVEGRYGELDPAVVSAELGAAAEQIARDFETVAGDAWLRTGRRGDGVSFTVETFAVYLIHDATHHLWDVSHA